MDCWITHPKLCQFAHPWHWLAYGNNSGAVAALMAALGFIGLILYTAYTRRMMNVAAETRKAAIVPVFSISKIESAITRYADKHFITYALKIRNVGQGPAVLLHAWLAPTDKVHEFTPMPSAAIQLRLDSSDLMMGESIKVVFNLDSGSGDWAFVFDAQDQENGRAQLQAKLYSDPHALPDIGMYYDSPLPLKRPKRQKAPHSPD